MEQHQIPRQITTFEFKLIGFMTLTQFVYLIVFLPLSYIVLRVIPIPILNVLLAFGIAFLGLALAFLPINSRPLDIWIKNLYKRIVSPTQFFYSKQAHGLEFIQNLYFDIDPHKVEAHVASQEALTKYLSTKKEDSTHLDAAPSFLSHLEEKKLQITSILQKPYELLVRGDQKSSDKIEKEDEEKPLAEAEADRSADKEKEEEFVKVEPTASAAPADTAKTEESTAGKEEDQEEELKLEEQKEEHTAARETKKSIIEERQDIREEQKEALGEKEADEVVERLKELSKGAHPPEVTVEANKPDLGEEKPTVAVPSAEASAASAAPADTAKTEESTAGSSSSVVENVGTSEDKEDDQISKKPAPKKPFFAGVVKNAKNIPLPGILIYVKGTDSDKPLRLLKSNPYGVFATYNPIPGGIYTFEIRDPKGLFNFDTMKVAIKDGDNEILEFYSK